VVVLVDLKTANHLVLESELQSLQVTRVAHTTKDELEVSTTERWRYYDRSLKPGAPLGQTFVVDTTLRYHFVREEGRWKLERARTLATTFLEPRGFALSQAHPAPDAGRKAGVP